MFVFVGEAHKREQSDELSMCQRHIEKIENFGREAWKMSFADLKELVAQITPILPLMVMTGLMNNYMVTLFMLLPVLIKFAEWVVGKYTDKIIANDKFHLKITEKTADGGINYIYNYITFIIEEKNLIQDNKNLEVLNCRLRKDRPIKIGRLNPTSYTPADPIITPATGCSIKLKEEDFEVRITMTNMTKEGNNLGIEKKIYDVSANTNQDIQKFMKYVKGVRAEYLKQTYGVKADTLHMNDYRGGQWNRQVINVKKTFKNIFLDSSIKRQLIHQLRTFEKNQEQYDKHGIAYKIGYLFYGAPGNGKTSTVIAIAAKFERNIYRIDLNNITGDELVSKIRQIPNRSIVLMEDIDTASVAKSREDSKPSTSSFLECNLGKLLEVLDGYCYLHNCIIIMTSNHPERLDKALIRPGRIDHKVEFKNASREQICAIVKHYFGEDITIDHDIDISVSEFINTVVLPHLNDYASVVHELSS